MPRMTLNHQGYHNASDEEAEQLKEAGWTVVSEKEFQEVLHAKRKAAMPEAPKVVVKAPAPKVPVKHGNGANTDK